MELRNDHNVYILGAGFSHDVGLPLLADFLTRMRDSHPWLEKEGRTLEADAVKEVLEFRLSAASAAYWTTLDLENIEELFSLASAGPGKLGGKIQLAIAATLDFVQATATTSQLTGNLHLENLPCASQFQWLIPAGEHTEHTHDFVVSRYVHHAGMLLGIFNSGAVEGRNTFVTFNYDTVLEDALSVLKIPFCYGFKRKKVNYDHSAKASKAANVNVLKLHGSVNWARQRPKRSWSFTVFGNYSDVRSVSLTPELLPPTWKKVFSEHLLEVWESAIDNLKTATRIVVIGFSLPPTDLHFKYLLAAGLQENVSLREIVFVNPAADEIKERASELLRKPYIEAKRVRFESLGLRDFVTRQGFLRDIDRPVHKDAKIQFV